MAPAAGRGGSEKSFSFLVVISPPPPPKPWRHLCSYRQQHNWVQPRAPHFVAPPTKWLRRKRKKRQERNGSTWRFGHRVFRKIERFESYYIVFGNFLSALLAAERSIIHWRFRLPPPPLLFGFLRFFEAAFFRGAIRSLQEKVEGGGKPPFAVCRGGGQFHNCLFWRGRRDGNTTPTALPSMQP